MELVDSMDPFSEGIIFSVMPPKKSWKNISNLSGGEKVRYWGKFCAIADPVIDTEFSCSCFRIACIQGTMSLVLYLFP